MITDRLQTKRFEIKYQIDDRTAHAIRRVLRTQLEPDEFGASADLPVYSVHSLYLDSPDFRLCRATFNGDRNRFKLRVRYYNDDPVAPVYLEIKRREDHCIRKQRALVRREALPGLLAGEFPGLSHLAHPSARDIADLEAFCGLARRLGARPAAHVAYEREAWLSAGHNSVRVTFDRAVRCEPVSGLRLETAFREPAEVFPRTVILEIKFTDRFPGWLNHLVSRYSLRQCGAAKYAGGLALSRAPLGAPGAALREFSGFAS